MKTKIITALAAALFFRCASKPAENQTEKKPMEITLSDEQIKSLTIKTEATKTQEFISEIRANGMIDVPPQNLVVISAPMGGFVKSTSLLQGMKVTKGQVLAVMEHQDYIQLQQDYLENKSQLEYLEKEYQRQGELAKENATAQKTLQWARAQYLGVKAKCEGILAKLKFIGIAPASIEQGISSSILILSPIDGYVTQVFINRGKYVNTADEMFRLVDNHHLHAELQVFEKDVPHLRIGQSMRVKTTSDNREYAAEVHLIGKEIDANRAVRVHGHFIKEESDLFMPGQYITASIKTGSRQAQVLPRNSFVSKEGKDFVFCPADDRTFKLEEVKKGNCNDDVCEVIFLRRTPPEIVTEGAYALIGLMNGGEE